MDDWMFRREARYVKHMHPNKSTQWRKNRYWGRLNKERGDQWVFGDKHTARYLLKFGWFKIERHVMVKGMSSPDDPSLREYWMCRRRVNTRNLAPSDVKIAE